MEIIVIPCLYDNYSYLICNPEQARAAVVDPAEAWPVHQVVRERELNLEAVLCTHHHHDHVGGIEELLEYYPDLEIYGYHAEKPRIRRLNRPLEDGDQISVCGVSGTALHTPGHTAGGLTYRFGDRVFTGDTLFGAGCGRLFEGTPAEMMASLSKIVAGGPEQQLYFGHEYTLLNLRFAAQVDPENEEVIRRRERVQAARDRGEPSAPSTMSQELQTNPFLRCGDQGPAAYLEQQGVDSSDPLAVFTGLREIRNSFS